MLMNAKGGMGVTEALAAVAAAVAAAGRGWWQR